MSVVAPSVVAALALVRQRMSLIGERMRADPSVRSTAVAVTPRRNPAGDRVECYADANLASDNWVGAWLEFWHHDGSWTIESSIRCNTEDGEDELVGLATRYAVEDDEFVAELDGGSSALVEAARSIVLSNL